MQRIQSLRLPEQLPTPQTLESWGQNQHDYEPEFWEFHYDLYRYLENIDDKILFDRYRDIHRNFCVLVRPERDIIPINSFLSSWFWYQKEHQTRYEFYLRKLSLPLSFPFPRGSFEAPVRSGGPNSCDILFRYGPLGDMRSFVEKGEIKMSLASAYKDGHPKDPRTDDELQKERFLPGQHTRIISPDGRRSPIIGDLRVTVAIPTNYYALCMSTDFEPEMFKEFPYDSCVIIKKPDQFMGRLEGALVGKFPGGYFYHNPVQYFDPCKPEKKQYFDPTMCKDFRFAYQMEYRAILHPGKSISDDGIPVHLGSLENFCNVHIKN